MTSGTTSYGAAALGLGYTRTLSEFLAGLAFEALPAEAVHAARRGVMDWLGCALAGSRHPTIDILCAVLEEAGGSPRAPVIGRGLRLGLLDAAVANGQMGHVLDFDDTHMGGVVLHTSSPVLAALLALSSRSTLSGKALIVAYVAGFEAGVRAGQSAPDHHAGGWHLTGTLGSIAAGAAAAVALGLDGPRVTHALGIATTQAAGMQQNRGTMCKSFHAGKAAHGGLLAALLAERGFDSSGEILEGRRGFCRVFSDGAEPERIIDGLGSRWEIERNGHKPYACGVVLHPAIDAMAALGRRSQRHAADVSSVVLRVNPAAMTITGVIEPRTGLESKFSIYHSAAVAFIDRAAGISQYSDERAVDDDVRTLRGKVEVRTDESLARDQAEATVTMTDGSSLHTRVEHASGTVDNPMPDEAIEAKFLANATPVIGEGPARTLCNLLWRLEDAPDVGQVLGLAAGVDP